MNFLLVLMTSLIFAGCQTNSPDDLSQKTDQYSYDLGWVEGFCEVIDLEAKQLAISSPMRPEKMDKFIGDFEIVAARHNVSVYRETDLSLISDLWAPEDPLATEQAIFYNGNTLEEYFLLKAKREALIKAGKYEGDAKLEVARHWGRLLSYSPRKTNERISLYTDFRTMWDFGIRASNLFFYYKDLDKATRFYNETLGLELVADYGTSKVLRIASESYLVLVDAAEGMHSADEPKTVALALLTEKLEEWYEHLKDQNVKFKYDYEQKNDLPHDGFVIYDPEGYLLEFERFNQHPENERFIPILKGNKTISASAGQENQPAQGLGFHASIAWLYYKDLLGMQNFYQDVLGLEIVADQGWTKVYQVTNSGFIGLVDECRGMHDFTDEKAVNVSFVMEDFEAWFEYCLEKNPFELRSTELEVDQENRYKAFVGYDPEGYYMEFVNFYAHEDNTKLLGHLDSN